MRKILFSDRYGLTEAVLAGRKTMTRRIVKHPEEVEIGGHKYLQTEKLPYKVGEVVAVAQAYKDTCWTSPVLRLKDKPGWSNKTFVYAGLMPHQIRITNVRVERLQDISEEDCLREGIWKDNGGGRVIGYPFAIPFYYTFDGAVRDGKQLHWTTPKEAYSALIDKVSGKGTWESNPWVFVYEFELVK